MKKFKFISMVSYRLGFKLIWPVDLAPLEFLTSDNILFLFFVIFIYNFQSVLWTILILFLEKETTNTTKRMKVRQEVKGRKGYFHETYFIYIYLYKTRSVSTIWSIWSEIINKKAHINVFICLNSFLNILLVRCELRCWAELAEKKVLKFNRHCMSI